MYIIHQKVAHAFRVLTASKPMKYNLMSLTLWRTLAKIVEKIKWTKLKYLITAWLHSNNPLQRKHARRKLVFTVAVLLKGNRPSFSKQLGINCTCEQIGLFLISTRGSGSHWWKLLKSPICSRVQLIPNCFSNRPISYTNLVQAFAFRPVRHESGIFPFECMKACLRHD